MIMTDVRSVAANSRVENVLSGKLFEFLSRPSLVLVAATASAVGLLGNLIVGAENVVPNQEISAANRFPLLPDDLLIDDAPGAPGERILLGYENTTAGAITANSYVKVRPVA